MTKSNQRYISVLGLFAVVLISLIGWFSFRKPAAQIDIIVTSKERLNLVSGLVAELKDAGYEEGKSFNFAFSHGPDNFADELVKQINFGRPNLVVVAIGDAASQAVIEKGDDRSTPIIFASKVNPMKGSQKNVAGLIDLSSAREQLAYFKSKNPGMNSLQIYYLDDNLYFEALAKEMKKLAQAEGIDVTLSRFKDLDDFESTTLLSGSDAYYFDYACGNKLQQMPVSFVGALYVSREPVKGLDQNLQDFELGREMGRIIVHVLKGKKPGDIGVQVAQFDYLGSTWHGIPELNLFSTQK